MVLDFNLKWTSHIENLTKDINKQNHLLTKLSAHCSFGTLRAVYFSNIFSRLNYNVIMWGSSSTENINKLFKSQKRAVRILCRAKRNEHCKPLFRRLSMLTLPSVVIKEAAMYILRNCKSFNVRNQKCIFEKFSLSISERSPEVFCKRIFNKFPEVIRKIKMSITSKEVCMCICWTRPTILLSFYGKNIFNIFILTMLIQSLYCLWQQIKHQSILPCASAPFPFTLGSPFSLTCCLSSPSSSLQWRRWRHRD